MVVDVAEKKIVEDPISLMTRYKATGDVKLRNELVLHYSYIARVIAVQMQGVFANYAQMEDVVNEGVIALIGCVEKFDVSKGIKFESYAFMRVRGSVIDFVRKQDWLPRRVRQATKDIFAAHDGLCNELMREPTHQEIAERMNMPLKSLYKYYSEVSNSVMLSFEGIIQNAAQKEELLESFTDHNPPPDSNIYQQELKQELKNAIDTLTDNERLAVTLYYYEHLKLSNISKVIGVSEQRVSQILSKAIQKLRSKMNNYIKE